MHTDYNKDGMSDFMCTNAVGYLIRNNRLHAHVSMRSNDLWAGYRNDRAWQKYILDKLASDLDIESGDIYWNVTSLHLYEKDFYLADHFYKTGAISISKREYKHLYPDSMWSK
jgi:thymidylate synthase